MFLSIVAETIVHFFAMLALQKGMEAEQARLEGELSVEWKNFSFPFIIIYTHKHQVTTWWRFQYQVM